MRCRSCVWLSDKKPRVYTPYVVFDQSENGVAARSASRARPWETDKNRIDRTEAAIGYRTRCPGDERRSIAHTACTKSCTGHRPGHGDRCAVGEQGTCRSHLHRPAILPGCWMQLFCHAIRAARRSCLSCGVHGDMICTPVRFCDQNIRESDHMVDICWSCAFSRLSRCGQHQSECDQVREGSGSRSLAKWRTCRWCPRSRSQRFVRHWPPPLLFRRIGMRCCGWRRCHCRNRGSYRCCRR